VTIVPTGWNELPIADVILPVTSIDPRKQPSKDFQYIDIGSIDSSRQVIADHKTFKGRDAPSRARRVIQEGDVLFSTVRTYLKNIAAVPSVFSGALTSTGIAVLRPSARLDARYLFYWVTSEDFVAEISKAQDGTMYPAVSDRDVTSSLILVPPLTEQRRIVARLDSLTGRNTRAREELARIPNLIQKYRDAILSAAVEGRLSPHAPTWKTAPLSEHISWGPQNGIYLPQSKYGSGVSIVRIDDFQNGWIRERQSLRVVNATCSEIESYSLKLGDIVINRVNSPSHLGKLFVVPKGIDGSLFESNMMRLRTDQGVLPEWVALYLTSPKGASDLKKNAKWAVNQASINQGDVLGVNIPVPSIQQQKFTLAAVDRAFAWLSRIAAEHEHASRLLPRLDQAILAKAFRGELVPQSPNERTMQIAPITDTLDHASRGRRSKHRAAR
jgi:type I restriction enzyme S subunit